MEELKKKLHKHCVDFVEQRIATANTALEQAREAANDDTKSSAGDKFETTREMMQQEIERNKKLLEDAHLQAHMLLRAEQAPSGDIIKPGSIVFTDQGSFYISISAGQVLVDGQPYFAISPSSPIGQALVGKKVNDTISFNGRHYLIKELF